MICRSYAKLNLYLAVCGRMPDGYHSLITLFERISLSDRIILKKRNDPRITVRCSYPGVPSDAGNLCHRAAAALQKAARCRSGVDIRVHKRIPPGAGLGGGSSNAACVLKGLNELWGLHFSRRRLLALAGRIGADLPFFLYDSGFALAQGRGDRITPLNPRLTRPLWHLVVIPQHVVSTPVIYKKWDRLQGRGGRVRSSMKELTKHRKNVTLITQYIKYLKNTGVSRLAGILFNDLEPVTESVCPPVRAVKEALKERGCTAVMMSGSGPAVFALLDSRSQALALADSLKRAQPSWRIFTAATV